MTFPDPSQPPDAPTPAGQQGTPSQTMHPGVVFPPPGLPYPRPGFVYPPPPGFVYPLAQPVAPGGAPLAEAGERFVAHLIDIAIMTALNVIPMIAVLVAIASRVFDTFHRMQAADDAAARNGTIADPSSYLTSIFTIELIALAILVPISFIISYLYLVTYMSRSGQTVGKRVMKLKIVSAVDGSLITREIARKRWLVSNAASLFAPYFMYADSLWLLWDKPNRQCLHDKCADTVVVKLTS